MNISEEDIIKYVLFSEELAQAKWKYIQANEKSFIAQIKLYNSYQKFSKNNRIKNQVEQIAERIFSKNLYR